MAIKQLKKSILTSLGMAAGSIVILFLFGELRWEWSGARIYYTGIWIFFTIYFAYKNNRSATSEAPQPTP